MISTSVFYQNGVKKTEFVSDRFFLIFNGELHSAVTTDFGVPVEVIESEFPLSEKEFGEYDINELAAKAEAYDILMGVSK